MARQTIGVRISEDGIAALDNIAAETGATRSTALRVLLGEALRNTNVKQQAVTRLAAMRETI